jgi:hypothetical protein
MRARELRVYGFSEQVCEGWGWHLEIQGVEHDTVDCGKLLDTVWK